ncbi:MAG: hypothetical protein ACP5SF_03660 [Thermoplasmata archaeon]
MKITIDGNMKELNLCIMSEEPPRFGIGLKITDPSWNKLKENKILFVDNNECTVTDEVDIGDRTWFVFSFKNKKIAKKYLK